MRKILLFVLVLLSLSVYSQTNYFAATPKGLRDSLNIDKPYLVLDFENKTAEELYALTYKFIQTQYTNPKNALKGDIKNEYLSVGTYAPNVILLQKGIIGEPYFANIHFTAEFNFRDGRIRFEPSQIMFYNWENDQFPYRSTGGLTWSIFKKNGKPLKDFPSQLESYFNTYIESYIYFINNDGGKEDEW